jgi:hypothetical protein
MYSSRDFLFSFFVRNAYVFYIGSNVDETSTMAVERVVLLCFRDVAALFTCLCFRAAVAVAHILRRGQMQRNLFYTIAASDPINRIFAVLGYFFHRQNAITQLIC